MANDDITTHEYYNKASAVKTAKDRAALFPLVEHILMEAVSVYKVETKLVEINQVL